MIRNAPLSLREILDAAFDALGGVNWLVEWGENDPDGFLALYAKVKASAGEAPSAHAVFSDVPLSEPLTKAEWLESVRQFK